MPGTNLTREEARTRAELVRVESYDVELDLTTSETTFGSTTTIRFACHVPGSSTFADLVGARVHEVTLNGRSLDPAEVYADSRLDLTDLAAENELRVVADCTYSRTGEGLHRFVDPADGKVYTYSQFEVPDARRVYTTFEQPDLKGTFALTVTAPDGWAVVSNSDTPDAQPRGDGTAVWRFAPTPRLSTYITAVVAGEYVGFHDVHRGREREIPLGLWCRASMVEHLDTAELFALTKRGFDFFEDAFDFPYPFGAYDQLFVPEYNMGAMENAGCVTYRDDMLPRSRQTSAFYQDRADTVLHEMAHMWFGNLVTMRWWDDLWLNESFAEWAATHSMVAVTEHTDGWTSFTHGRKNWAYRQDQLPTTHPIAADNVDLEAVEVNFDGITYAKGGSALKQLVAWVGEDHFLQGLRDYFATHAFGNSELRDLLAALEKASGRDLASWAQEWLETPGVNTLHPRFELDEFGRYASFAVEQTALAAFPTLRRHRIGLGLYDRREGRLVLRERVEIDVDGELTDVEQLVGVQQPDLLLLNDGDLTYAKIRLDRRSLDTVLEGLHTLDDSLARALCWGAAWDMTRDGEMRARDYVELALRGLATETDTTALGRLPLYSRQATELFSDPNHRPVLRERYEAGLWELLEAAEPGSDHQLALVRGWAAAVSTDAGLDRVQRLLDGEEEVPGLVVDTDLRWSLLVCLASHGRADEVTIAAEEERDHTITGQENAAAARATRPTTEAKEAAWQAAVVRDDVPNETQRSIAYSFVRTDQVELLEPYLERYLEVAGTLWESKGVQRASTVLEAMFPRPLVSRQTLERVDAWLASTTANPAAKRYVAEGRADVARALAAQQRDAAPR